MRIIVLLAAIMTAAAGASSDAQQNDCHAEREDYATALRGWHSGGRRDEHRRMMLDARARYEACAAQSSLTSSSLWVTRGLEGQDWDVRAEFTMAGGHVEINARTFFQGAWRPWRGSGTVDGDTLRFDYEVETGNAYGWLDGSGELTFQNDRSVLAGYMHASDGSWFTPVMFFRAPVETPPPLAEDRITGVFWYGDLRITFLPDGSVHHQHPNGNITRGRWEHDSGNRYTYWRIRGDISNPEPIWLSSTREYIIRGAERWVRE